MLDLSVKQAVKGNNVTSWSGEINQLYRPLAHFYQDSQELVYARDNINTTKFAPILLKEWFYLIKQGGYLVIDYKQNKICDWRKLEETMWWLWKGRYDVVFHGIVGQEEIDSLNEEKIKRFIFSQNKYYENNLDAKTLLPLPVPAKPASSDRESCFRFVCRKNVSTKIEEDEMSKWAFGIITNGKRMDWMERIISSIRKQKIPECEIIVCGTYFDRKEPDFVYLPFNKRDDAGWITKKKNLIVKKAKFENICVLHDRLVLANDWYAEMSKYGNCFEYLTCRQMYDDSLRAYDWITAGGPMSEHYKIQMLDYRDWDRYAVIGGMVTITKKSIINKIMWDESRFWNDFEDLQLSAEYHQSGFLPRVNPDAKIISLGFRHGLVPTRRYYTKETWKVIIPQDMYIRSIIRIILNFLGKIPCIIKFINWFFNKFLKDSRFYRFITKSR